LLTDTANSHLNILVCYEQDVKLQSCELPDQMECRLPVKFERARRTQLVFTDTTYSHAEIFVA
jgi:hypothetical protein